MAVVHRFKSLIHDSTDPQDENKVKPSHWNEMHLLDPALYVKQLLIAPTFIHEMIEAEEHPWIKYNPFPPPDGYPDGLIREPIENSEILATHSVIGVKTFVGSIGLFAHLAGFSLVSAVNFTLNSLIALRFLINQIPLRIGFPSVFSPDSMYTDIWLDGNNLICYLRVGDEYVQTTTSLSEIDNSSDNLIFKDRFGLISFIYESYGLYNKIVTVTAHNLDFRFNKQLATLNFLVDYDRGKIIRFGNYFTVHTVINSDTLTDTPIAVLDYIGLGLGGIRYEEEFAPGRITAVLYGARGIMESS
jgi:hypothetical protein